MPAHPNTRNRHTSIIARVKHTAFTAAMLLQPRHSLPHHSHFLSLASGRSPPARSVRASCLAAARGSPRLCSRSAHSTPQAVESLLHSRLQPTHNIARKLAASYLTHRLHPAIRLRHARSLLDACSQRTHSLPKNYSTRCWSRQPIRLRSPQSLPEVRPNSAQSLHTARPKQSNTPTTFRQLSAAPSTLALAPLLTRAQFRHKF